jgi:hypothetical protein
LTTLQFPEVIYFLLGFALGYRHIAAALKDKLKTQVFMTYVFKLLKGGDLPRAIKICSATYSPFANAVKQVLMRSIPLRKEGPEALLSFCEATFLKQATITRTKRSFASLSIVLFVFVSVLYFVSLNHPTPATFVCLGLFLLAAFYDIWTKTKLLSDLETYPKPLVDALMQAPETPNKS